MREIFEFSARIRSNLSDVEVNQTVDETINMMGLSACSDQMIGGWMRRGISGGERKRASIGYEMISKPSLLLLDEPTSGLDSSTAMRILQLLQKRARQGMTVVATIHQPSSDLFMLFDRVILLSEGYTVYNGPPQDVKPYFENYGLVMGNYSNPADKLSIIADYPRKVLNENITIQELAADCQSKQKENIELSDDYRFGATCKGLSTRFSFIAQHREVSYCK